MIRTKLKRNTRHDVLDGKKYCLYCGKEIKSDGEYFHCNCESALKQMEIEDKIAQLAKEQNELESQMPETKFTLRYRQVIEKI